jgi:hypothetical protein
MTLFSHVGGWQVWHGVIMWREIFILNGLLVRHCYGRVTQIQTKMSIYVNLNPRYVRKKKSEEQEREKKKLQVYATLYQLKGNNSEL